MRRVVVPYDHRPERLEQVYIAVSGPFGVPLSRDWVPAYRDVENGHRVVWARFPEQAIQSLGQVFTRGVDGEVTRIPSSEVQIR